MIKLPPEITFKKERLSYGWTYNFRHKTLGALGRVVLQGRDDGRTHITCEVAGDPDDPRTKTRAEIFQPLGIEIARQMDIATGGTGENADGFVPPRRTRQNRKRVSIAR